MRKLSIDDLAERGIELTPEQEEHVRSISETDHEALLVELDEDLTAWGAVEVVVALASSKPDEISCEVTNVIRLWWD